ncbi:thiamine pyrophosphate-binding protein [Roseomonas sp. GC11]|uniref:thiamine pyrophosphate-binding protein n=1 Tax=Roseomonas sp. GC11 TaxID=2950546 RepID=UPI00210C949C|nr:thiamine pyrophosphate-binding protein [Roseomonas sp. GC11]MCQ4159627.1 thiamine pyrophosphate-binding protein [Roseomonas sp. GC11]
MMKYSDVLAGWLAELGYTHCFFVAGGNVMHVLASFDQKFTMVPVVHEVCAGIAAEYFNEISGGGKAFALVTAGPGLTNIVTAIGGAWLESRELLVIGGQVKTADLAHGALRQRGIQEIDGVGIAAPITVASVRMEEPAPRAEWERLVGLTRHGRRGPVFVELPLDIQARPVDPAQLGAAAHVPPPLPTASEAVLEEIAQALRGAERPAILIGGGIHRDTTAALRPRLAELGIPLVTTWNGADRVPEDHPLYFGRPNTWGQRSANLVLQQSDVLLVLGSRLGLQQTGFNWQEFAPVARVIQVEIDPAELAKGHPKVALPVAADANDVLRRLAPRDLGRHEAWVAYCRRIRDAVPLVEPVNQTGQGYLSPFVFCTELSGLCGGDDIVIPCSSGGAFTVMKQSFRLREGQFMVTNKGLAAMGYGLSGAIGAALAYPQRRTVLVEGDGGFAQNLQEIGTAVVNKLNLKIFIFDDGGYASIRMTQRNYFKGGYIGCDTGSGLGMPHWARIFDAYDVPCLPVLPGFETDPAFRALFDAPGVAAFLVKIDPEQSYFPKITSRVTASGGMASEPLHRMTPPLEPALMAEIGRYLPPSPDEVN